ncbi:HOOK-domain-containing protein [Cantharellus anzutake]|uniref:HOOK-domain-containing protein n=1 Tax=Cantharellus anzutake TaxID=1750568 RepID=UPI00190798A0|nr:HOOK-domain-containing protein [Cantharellus anzutake]KAF8321421.1 HOOK-domain-containing protein [Cantharellus anzutake]
MDAEAKAVVAWLSTYDLSRPVANIADLSDGLPLFDVLSKVDADYFRVPARTSTQQSENWVLRQNSLKRLYRLITQYFTDVLHQQTSALGVPNLQDVAEKHDVAQTLALCRLTLAIAVQGPRNKNAIERIQRLDEADQRALMFAIEQVMKKIPKRTGEAAGEISMTDDDHYYELQNDLSRLTVEKETLQKAYQALMGDHRNLQNGLDEALSEKADISSRLHEAELRADEYRNSKTDALMRAEIDRLRSEIQKAEDSLITAEAEIEKQSASLSDLTRKNDDLQMQANQAARLKDQVDELRHTAEKAQKTENVMGKYKKKLEESADLRRLVKTLEEQNASLVDKNASLEEEYRKVATFRPLMDSYKTQIADLEAKASTRAKEIETLKYELTQTKAKLNITLQERVQDAEALELYQEKVKELELTDSRNRARNRGDAVSAESPQEAYGGTGGPDFDLHEDTNLGGELDDAISGRTMTDLKLQIRRLKLDLQEARNNSSDASRVIVLENLLEDTNRVKARYEADYLSTHREKLMLQSQLDEIRSGKSGDNAEVAIALRQRLNEVSEQLDRLREEHAQLQVTFDAQSRELVIAKSDLNLVNKDQLDILATLRESVNEDKSGLENQVQKLQSQLEEQKGKNKMQLEQINTLLMEKVNLQSEGIGQREKMLERERNLTDLRASFAGGDLPEETKTKLLHLHEENIALKEQVRTSHEKLLKMRQFIKEQDRMIKENRVSSGSSFEEAEESFKSKISMLEEDLKQSKTRLKEAEQRYQKEQTLMLSSIHNMGMEVVRAHQINPRRNPGGIIKPTAWLTQQRDSTSGSLIGK